MHSLAISPPASNASIERVTLEVDLPPGRYRHHCLRHLRALVVTQHFPVLRAADRYAYISCGSTAYCYLFYLGDEKILIHIRKPCWSSACLVRIAGPFSAVPFQLRYTNVGTYEPANSHRDAAYSQQGLPGGVDFARFRPSWPRQEAYWTSVTRVCHKTAATTTTIP